jgi:hypothetical protein
MSEQWSKEIENPAGIEVRGVVRFLNAQNVRPIEIYRQLLEMFGEGVTVKKSKVKLSL